MSKYAIVIGINHYNPPERNGLIPLNGAITDAEQVYAWLTGPGGVPVQNCRLIISTEDPRNPIKNVVDQALGEIVQQVVASGSDADRFYFYFAGHGIGVERDAENNGLCMADWSEFLADSSAISTRSYRQKLMSEGLFKEIIVWLDCCRNTKIFFEPNGAPRIQPLGPNNAPRWFTGYATQYQNESFEVAGEAAEKRGIFTSVLLEALEGAAAGGVTPVNADQLRNYLYQNVPRKAQEAGYSQIPEIAHNTYPDRYLMFP